MRFDLSWFNLIFSAASLIAGATFAWIAWQRSGFAWRVACLETLRLLLIGAAVLTLLQPELLQIEKDVPPSEIAVLYDDSASMTTRDMPLEQAASSSAMQSRAEAISRFRDPQSWSLPAGSLPVASTEASTEVSAATKVVLQPFSSATAASPESDGPPNSEVGTDLHGALQGVLDRPGNTRAVVIASDGDWNLGSNPIQAARELRARDIPVYSLGVGSRQKLPDVAIQSFDVPTFAVVGKPLRIPFVLESSLPQDLDLQAELTLPNGEVLQSSVRIPAMGIGRGLFEWRPKQVGEGKLTMRIPVDAREQIIENNQEEVSISLRHESLKVLMIETYPRWEYRYTRNALERDPGVDVHCLMMHPDIMELGDGRGYLKDFPSEEELFQYDVVFLGDIGIGPNQLTEQQGALLRRLVERQAGGLVFMPGFRGYQLGLTESSLGDLLPVDYDTQAPRGVGGSRPAQFQLTEQGRVSLLTRLETSDIDNEEVWRSLPGFYWYAAVEKARSGSQVLATHERDATRYGRVPLIVTKTFGNGKVLYMGSDGAWRWRKGVEDKYHYRFWGQVVRWMAYQRTMANGDSMRLMYSPDRPKVGDLVTLEANVMSQQGEPLQQGTVVTQITGPDGKTENLTLQRSGEEAWGLFSGTFRPTSGGEYRIVTSCRETGKSIESTISIPKTQREQIGIPARLDVLEEISQVSRGQSFSMDKMDELFQTIQNLPAPKPQEHRLRLWCHPLWGALIVFLLGLFWTGRKYAGLI